MTTPQTRLRDLQAYVGQVNSDSSLLRAFVESPVRELQVRNLVHSLDDLVLTFAALPVDPVEGGCCLVLGEVTLLPETQGNSSRADPPCRMALNLVRSMDGAPEPAVRPSVRVVPVIVNNAADQDRVDRDFDAANRIFARCGLEVLQGATRRIHDDRYGRVAPLCIPGDVLQPDPVRELLSDRDHAAPFDVLAYYVQAIDGNLAGCGGFFRIGQSRRVPAIMLDAEADHEFVFSHEIGHVLGLPHAADDDTNLMCQCIPTVDPPRLTADQCERVRRSRIIQDYGAVIGPAPIA